MSGFDLPHSGAGFPDAAIASASPRPVALKASLRIDRVPYLRAVAACSVVMFHVIANYVPTDSLLQRHGVYNLLSGGVDIFFFISGFLIRTTTYRRFGPDSLVDYLKKRFARVVPYYWLVTLTVMSISLLAPGVFRSYHFEWRHALASMFFIPWPRPDGLVYPPLVQGWSLNFEIVFYLVFAALMLGTQRERAFLWLLGGFSAAIGIAGLSGLNTDIFIVGNLFTLEFAFGVGFADLWRRREGRFAPSVGWLAASLGCLLLGSTYTSLWGGHWGPQTLAFPLLGMAFLTLPAPRLPASMLALLALLGEASYSIYLVHPVVLSPVAQIVSRAGFAGQPSAGFALAIGGLAIGVGLLAWRFIETPLLVFTRRRLGVGQNG